MAQAKQTLSASVDDLWRVAETNDIRTLERILSCGVDVDARNEHGTTALMRAAHHGRLHMVKALIASGADPNAVRRDNFTPLTLAAFFGHTEIVRLLVQAGAETDRVTRNGTSARMWASARTFQGVAKYLDEAQPPPTDLKVAAVGPQAEPPPPNEVVDSNISQVDDSVGVDDLVESAPSVTDETLSRATRSLVVARNVSLKSAAFFAVLLIMTVAALALLSQRSKRNNLETATPTPTTSAGEPSVANVVPIAPTVLETPAAQTTEEVRTPDSTRTRRDNGHAARVPKRRFAEDNDNVPTRKTLKPPPKKDVAIVPVSNPAPVSKKPVSPLSTQLVSSPSKSAPKPKVIQWP